MNKKTISILIPVVILLVIALIIIDFTSSKPDRRGDNPYEYSVDEYRHVDESIIHYKETKNIPVGSRIASCIEYYKDHLYLGGEGFLQVVNTSGIEKNLFLIEGKPEGIKVNQDKISLIFENSIRILNHQGDEMNSWLIENPRTILTSIAIKDDILFVADAGNRRVLRFNSQGDLLGEFEGKRESQAGHGFIVPSPNFDLVVNSYGELWVANPGEHAVENYSDEGEMRGYWTKSSMQIEGFTGCCNPAEIAVLEDGSFITSEKGLVRIKIYNPSGELRSVVAPPSCS